MRKQNGVSMLGVLFICIGLVLVVVAGLKVTPAYLEYMAVKKAVAGVVQGGEARGTVAEIRRAFDKHAQIDDINVISGTDLEISKEGNDVVVAFSYPKKIPLFGNVSIYFDFSGSSK